VKLKFFWPFWNCSGAIKFYHSLSNVCGVTSIDIFCIQFWQCLVIQLQKDLNKKFVSSSFCTIVGWILHLWLVGGCILILFAMIELQYSLLNMVLNILWLQGTQTSFNCCPPSCREPISNLIWDKYISKPRIYFETDRIHDSIDLFRTNQLSLYLII